MELDNTYKKGFFPYALTTFLIDLVGGFSTVLGPSFVQDIGIAYNNTTWTALAQAMSTAACAPILGKVGDVRSLKVWHRPNQILRRAAELFYQIYYNYSASKNIYKVNLLWYKNSVLIHNYF